MSTALRDRPIETRGDRAPVDVAGTAARGSLWLATSMLLTRASGFLVSVALARLLAPEQFGLLGMANVVLTAIALVSELGLGAALVQRPRGRDFEAAASTAFWTNLLFGWVLVAANWLCAPAAAWYFRNPDVTLVLQVMGVQFGTNALGAVHHALLTRELDYRRKLLPDTVPSLVNGLIALWGAAHGWGVWSLVAGAQVGALAGVLVVWASCRWRPAFVWDRALAGQLLGYGKHIIGAELLRFVTQNVDFLVVGRLFGPGALGVYMLAFNLANLVATQVGYLFARLAFPLFSRLQDDLPRLRQAYLRSLVYMTLLSLPIAVGLGVLADEFVQVAYGERWSSAVGPLRALTILGTIRALPTLSAAVLRALGRPDVMSRLALVTAPLAALGALAGAAFGLTGVALGESIVMAATGAFLVRAALELLGLRPRELWQQLWPLVRAAAVMGVVTALPIMVLTASGSSPAWRLFVGVTAGAAGFCAALGQQRATLWRELRRSLRIVSHGDR